MRRIEQFLRNSLLNIAAAGGAVCIAAVVCAVVFDISLIMFKTGSMAPAIPAGSVAVVRQIPAAEIRVGDIVTVDRADALPITHRVQTVEPGDGHQHIITMKGDANPGPDPAPYTMDTVRTVMVSFPGLAPLIVAASRPLVMGSITVAVAGLVTWTLWPRASVRVLQQEAAAVPERITP